MFPSMANLKKKILTDKEKDRDQIQDWMNSPAGGYILGGTLVAFVIWAIIGWITG